MKKYSKKIDISSLSVEECSKLEGIIYRLGYAHKDYRVVEFSDQGREMHILNKELHRDMRTVRKTSYKKAK